LYFKNLLLIKDQLVGGKNLVEFFYNRIRTFIYLLTELSLIFMIDKMFPDNTSDGSTSGFDMNTVGFPEQRECLSDRLLGLDPAERAAVQQTFMAELCVIVAGRIAQAGIPTSPQAPANNLL
jgi:hypothetical protein